MAKRAAGAAAVAGLCGLAVAVAIVALRPSGARRPDRLLAGGSQKGLAELERETFESPDATYAKTLSALKREPPSPGAASEMADAWASGAGGEDNVAWDHLSPPPPGWRHITKRAAQDVPLEKQIAADVSKKLAKTVDRDVAQALHVELHGRAAREGRTQLIPDYTYKRGGYAGDDSSNLQKTPAGNYYGQFHGGAGNVHTGTYGAVGGSDPRTRLTRAQRKLVRQVKAQVALDAARTDRDKKLQRWLMSRIGGAASRRRTALRNKFATPLSSAEVYHQDMIGAEPFKYRGGGPSDTYNYWGGAHYADEEGLPDVSGARLIERDGDRMHGGPDSPGPEAPTLVDPNRDKLEARGVKVRSPYAERRALTMEFRTKDEEGGTAPPGGQGALDQDPVGEAALNEAGVVTDRLPLLGSKRQYQAVLPLPMYEKPPSAADASEAHGRGHRFVSDTGKKVQHDLGVTLASPNALVYSTEAGSHTVERLPEAQAQFVATDGLGDTMESKEDADEHRPLDMFLDPQKTKAGPDALEKARVNVWGEPLAKMLPHGLFDTGSQDEGASKLAAAGVTVDRDSPVARSPAVGE